MAVAAMATSMFAADVAATVQMEGSLAGGDKDSTYIWKLNKKDQKDADAAIISVSGDKAGAQFQLWYNYNAGKEADIVIEEPKAWETAELDGKMVSITGGLQIRNTNVWFKPIDMLKVTVGDVSSGAWFGNTLDYWKNPVGGKKDDFNSWGAKYSSFATVEGCGVMAELTPIEGLVINGGITAGVGNSFVTIAHNSGNATVAAYGVGAKYTLGNLPLTAGVTFRDSGKDEVKLLSVGVMYGGAYADGFHTSINARLRMNEGNAGKLDGITIDNYFRFGAGALAACLRAPVTIRTANTDADPSYMVFSAKVSYGLGTFTPYLLFGSDLDNNNAIVLTKFADTFQMQIQPGVTCNVGSCALDVAARINIADKAANNAVSWSIPFTAKVSF